MCYLASNQSFAVFRPSPLYGLKIMSSAPLYFFYGITLAVYGTHFNYVRNLSVSILHSVVDRIAWWAAEKLMLVTKYLNYLLTHYRLRKISKCGFLVGKVTGLFMMTYQEAEFEWGMERWLRLVMLDVKSVNCNFVKGTLLIYIYYVKCFCL